MSYDSEDRMPGGWDRCIWTEDQTRALLQCYAGRLQEFQRPRKKNIAYARVRQDLLKLEVIDDSYIDGTIENKIKSLKKAYRLSKAKQFRNANKTIKPFLEVLQDLFEDDDYDKLAFSRSGNDESIDDNNSLAVSPDAGATDPLDDTMEESSPKVKTLSNEAEETVGKKTSMQRVIVETVNKMVAYEKARETAAAQRFEKKLEMMRFINAEKNRRHRELLHALRKGKLSEEEEAS